MFGGYAKRIPIANLRTGDGGFASTVPRWSFKQGETRLGDKGKKDKGKRESQQKARLTKKEKRKLKREKKK